MHTVSRKSLLSVILTLVGTKVGRLHLDSRLVSFPVKPSTMVLPLYVQLYDTQALLRHRACSKKAGAVSSLVQRAGQPSHQRSQLTAVAAAASFSSSSSTSSSRQQPQEQEQELVRAPSPPPKPVPIIHTTAYLQQTQQLLVSGGQLVCICGPANSILPAVQGAASGMALTVKRVLGKR